MIRLRREPTDQRAWNEFAQRYGRLIGAWCRQWGLQPADADDVSQNVLLKLANHLRGFVYDPGRRFRGFLRTVTHNACKDYLASTRRAAAAPTPRCMPCSIRPWRATTWQRGWRRPSTWSGSRWPRPASGKRVEPHTWEAFRLTALEGQSGAEAAAVLHMQVGTVFKAKSKVQRMLREEIERLESEEPVWMTVPNRSELEDFLTDRLPAEGESRVLTHLEGCPACQQVLETLTADPVAPRCDPDRAWPSLCRPMGINTGSGPLAVSDRPLHGDPRARSGGWRGLPGRAGPLKRLVALKVAIRNGSSRCET